MSIMSVVWVDCTHQIGRQSARLFVKGVPEEKTEEDIKRFLEEMGYYFGEFGIPWANYAIVEVNKAQAQVRGAYRNAEVETIEWKELEPIKEEG